MENFYIAAYTYDDFDGRIITNEAIMYREAKEKICVQWDCGSTRSSISQELVKKLNMQPCGKSSTTSITDSISTNVYEIILVLHDTLEIPMIVDAVSNIHITGIDMLIGMEVISLGDFAISTYDNKTCFSFRCPSNGLIDFTKNS